MTPVRLYSWIHFAIECHNHQSQFQKLNMQECLLKKSTNVNAFLWIFQVAQIDMLQKMGLQPDGIVGHSVGELACGYADGSLSHSEAVLAAYWRGRCIKEANLPAGGMAAVGQYMPCAFGLSLFTNRGCNNLNYFPIHFP